MMIVNVKVNVHQNKVSIIVIQKLGQLGQTVHMTKACLCLRGAPFQVPSDDLLRLFAPNGKKT